VNPAWVLLPIGIVITIVGVMFVLFPGPITTAFSTLQRATFGRLARPIVSRFNPRVGRGFGIYAIVFGGVYVTLCVVSILRTG
jgi:hypothetical protein